MRQIKERQGIIRLLMVLSSISPLFILWLIRGNGWASQPTFQIFCLIMIFVPTIFLCWRIYSAIKERQNVTFFSGKSEDNRNHLLIYLFTILFPLYSIDLITPREHYSALTALAFIIFLFWHMNLHYMNIIFALFGYRIFTVNPMRDNNTLSGKTVIVLITKRAMIPEGEQLNIYRLSNTVYFEYGDNYENKF